MYHAYARGYTLVKLTCVGDVLRQGPKMRKWLKSPLRFFRSVYLWRIKPKIQNSVNKG